MLVESDSIMAGNVGPLSAEIITTGTEILLGDIVDTNAAWIAQQLRDNGVNLYYKTTVGDNEERMREVLRLGLTRSDVLIVTGGLGPTADDVTRQAIARATGRSLAPDAGALAAIRERFDRFGVSMTDNNRRQALMPEGARIIPNPVGTAPGILLETDDRVIVALPGVPREMKRMVTDTVIPYLRDRSGYRGVIRRRVMRTIGIGESALDDILGSLMLGANPTVGLAAKTAQADIRIAARADSVREAEAMIEETAQSIRQLVGSHVYSEVADQSIEEVVTDLLRTRGETLSLVETNTMGDLAGRILRQKHSGAVLIGARTLADTGEEVTALGCTPEGLIPTEENALRCASTIRAAMGATYGLAILGTSGEDDGIYGRAEGATWLALVGPPDDTATKLPYGGTDDYTVTRIGNQGLNLLWQLLQPSQ